MNNRWVNNTQKNTKAQQNTFQSAVQKIQSINIYQRLRNLQNRYQMYKSIDIVFKNNRKLLEQFGKTFYKAFLFWMVPKFKEQWESEKISIILQLKKFYMEIFNRTEERRRSFFLEFYCFLLCLSVKGVMDFALGQAVDTSHLFKKKNQNSERIQTAEIAFIFLTFQTLGLKVGTFAFTLLFKKYVERQTINENLFDLGKICISNDFLLSLCKPKQKSKTEEEQFYSILKQNLKVSKPQFRQKKKKVQLLKTQISSRDNSQFNILAAFPDSQTRALYQTMRANQLSTSFNFYNKYEFQRGVRTPTVKMYPVNLQTLSKMSKKRVKHLTQFRLKESQKKQISLPQKKWSIKYWQGKIKQMRNDATHRLSCEQLTFNYRKKQQQDQIQNLLATLKGKKSLRSTSIEFNQQKQEADIPIVYQQQQQIHRNQMGLVIRMQNYPCTLRKSTGKKTFGMKPIEIKQQLNSFTQACKEMQKKYNQSTVNQTLSQIMPYLGKRKKRRKQSCL